MTKHPTFRLKSAAYFNGLQVHVFFLRTLPPKKKITRLRVTRREVRNALQEH
jgi:hypothetical protein